ncbi:MAG: hypothetical protein K2Y32_08495 [Candidatus Obscuribacterales bacterium]|nr:hypothetical protein [Candidatus Obscuribacterales bacterium]
MTLQQGELESINILLDKALKPQTLVRADEVDKALLYKKAEELAFALYKLAHYHVKARFPDEAFRTNLQFSHPSRLQEPIDWVSKQEMRSKTRLPTSYFRWKMTGAPLIISCRAGERDRTGIVEFFLVPEREVPHITMSEFGSRFRIRFQLIELGQKLVWVANKTKLSSEAAKLQLESLFNEVLEVAYTERIKPNQNLQPTEGFLYQGKPINTIEQRLELQRNNLLFKLLNQQEELKNQLARDLHDSVIADLMMLKRYLSGDRKLSSEETIEIVDEIVRQLRDLVNEYSPRQLQEWGLKVGVEDLLDRVSRRTGIDTKLVFQGELPRYPDLVTLHIFRIIQECLNNVEKHAEATAVEVEIRASKVGDSTFTIKDNGKGFDPKTVRIEADGSHSMGIGGMKERTELIKCFYPARITITSKPKPPEWDLTSSTDNGLALPLDAKTANRQGSSSISNDQFSFGTAVTLTVSPAE